MTVNNIPYFLETNNDPKVSFCLLLKSFTCGSRYRVVSFDLHGGHGQRLKQPRKQLFKSELEN